MSGGSSRRYPPELRERHPRRQARRHLPKRHRRRPQLLSQPIPRRGRRQQWARPRTRIHQHGVDFRGQNWKIQPPLPLPLTMRSHLIVSPRRGERGHFDKLICNIPIAYKRADICGALMPISACISCSAALTGWWSGTVASGEAGGLDVWAECLGFRNIVNMLHGVRDGLVRDANNYEQQEQASQQILSS